MTLTIGLEIHQNLKLGIQALEETVRVSGVTPTVEVTKTEVATVITQQQISMLPIEGRSAITLSLLLPPAPIGGPIVVNRAHVFAAAERTSTREFFTVSTGRPEFYGANEGTFEGGSLPTSSS